MTLRKSGGPRINRITAGITSYTTVKRLRFRWRYHVFIDLGGFCSRFAHTMWFRFNGLDALHTGSKPAI